MKELHFTLRVATEEEVNRSTLEDKYNERNCYILKTVYEGRGFICVIPSNIRIHVIIKSIKKAFNLL